MATLKWKRARPWLEVGRRLSLLSVLLVVGRGNAQTPRYRLTVRPREMAIGTRTVGAGEHQLVSNPMDWVYVPPQCVGTVRCPLLVFFFSAGPLEADKWMPRVADQYGMIAYAPEDPNAKFDAGLQELLRTFAIDPDRIAIIGRCAASGKGTYLGGGGVDVFNRVAFISGGAGPSNDPPSKATEYFVESGYGETYNNWSGTRALRDAGYRVKHIVGLRAHEHQVEDYDFVARWFLASWLPPAARPRPEVVADPLPVLTLEALTKMQRFWARFLHEPNAILITARRAHLREVALSVGEEEVSTVMTDMRVLAAQYPSVAADLQQAGLTAAQHEAYRVALLSAVTALFAQSGEIRPFPATSVLGQNVAFVDAHRDELGTHAGMDQQPPSMWNTP